MLLRDISLVYKALPYMRKHETTWSLSAGSSYFVIKAAKAIVHCVSKRDQALHFSDNQRPIRAMSRSLFLMEIKLVKCKTGRDRETIML